MNRIVLGLIPLLLVCRNSSAKEWRGIVPLHSARTDVERVLGPPKTDRSDWVVYESEAERVSIEFSRGPCDVEYSPWNVPRNTVINIWVDPLLRQWNTTNLKLNQKRYKKRRDIHRGDIVYYWGEKEGVEYSVDDLTGVVGLVKYLPAATDKALKCPEPRNLLSETIEVAQYSKIPLAKERRIRNKFAQKIIRYTSINYASAQAYIFIYDDEDGHSRDSTMRAEQAKTYLINTHRINPNRISILKAGYRKKLTIKLYLVPPGASPPHLGSIFLPNTTPICAKPSLDAPHGAC